MAVTGTILAVTQVYPPDPAAVGQHVADVATAMVRRGWRIVVLTSARGYDDASVRYPGREVLDGVEVVRLPLSSFGKGTLAQRLLAQLFFLAQATLGALVVPDLRKVLISTSPPPAAIAGCAISILRRIPVTYWVMDLNPDQLIATGRISASSLPARACDALNRLMLARAASVVVLDRFMAQRVLNKLAVARKLAVIPPWHPALRSTYPEHDQNPFRAAHDLDGKYVVMYSGNHSPVNPLTTLLSAAKRLRDDDRFVFVFVGGGQGKREVEAAIAAGYRNIRSLPYQPLDALGASLSAADLHVASIGDEMVGIVHPCKIYGAMAVGRPLLTFGPGECHLRELIDRYRIGWHVAHHDVDRAVQVLREAAALPRADARAMGERARSAARNGFAQETLVDSFCAVLTGAPTPRIPVEGSDAPVTERRPSEVRIRAPAATSDPVRSLPAIGGGETRAVVARLEARP